MRTKWVALCLVLAFFTLYAASASHTVILYNKDAAEFQTVGVAGGVLHQPYPLWCILARSFSLLPVGEPAFRITLLSIICSALTVGALFVLAFRQNGTRVGALCAAGAFGLSVTFWEYAAVAEVYSLWMLLFATLLVLADRLAKNPTESYVLLFLLTAGMLLSQQTLNIALLPALLLFLGRSHSIRWKKVGWRKIVLRLVAFVFPFTLYLYSYIQDRGTNPMNWLDNRGLYVAEAMGSDIHTQYSFFERLRFQLWIGRLEIDLPSAADIARNAYLWMRKIASEEFPLLSFVLIVVGFFWLFRRDRNKSAILLVLVVPYLVLAFTGFGEMRVYSMPAMMVLSLYLAEGVTAAWKRLGTKTSRLGRSVIVVLAVLILAFPFLRYAKSSPLSKFMRSDEIVAMIESSPGEFYHLVARSNDGMTYGVETAKVVASQGLIFGNWRQANVLFYHKYVSGILKDVHVYYIPPTRKQFFDIIDDVKPSAVYITTPPEAHGLGGIEIEAVHEIIPGEELYRLSKKDPIAEQS